jgi:hypothetical protein
VSRPRTGAGVAAVAATVSVVGWFATVTLSYLLAH